MNNFKIIPFVDISKANPKKFGAMDKSHVAEDHVWTFNNRNMDFEKNLNLKGQYCYHPFNTITVDKFGDVYLCICQAWLPISVGKIWDFNSFEEIMSCPKALEIQSSIIDGSYRYCDHTNCSIIQENELKGRIDHKYHTVNWINFAIDNSCNLTCPSCRTEFIYESDGPSFDLKLNAVNHLIKLIETHPLYLKFTLSGDGDPFASLVYRHFLSNLDLTPFYYDENGGIIDKELVSKLTNNSTNNKKLLDLRKKLITSLGAGYRKVEIELVTNGILIADHWHKLSKIHKNIVRTKISFDAGTESVYNVTRKGGSWKKLIEGAKFLAKWKQKNYSDMVLTANFVVQTANYKDMPAYVELCDQLGFDEINFQKITDWGTFVNFKEHAVWQETHPEHKNFLSILEHPSLNNKKINFTNLK